MAFDERATIPVRYAPIAYAGLATIFQSGIWPGIITEIGSKEKLISDYEDKKKELVEKINGAILARAQAFLALSQAFAAIKPGTRPR